MSPPLADPETQNDAERPGKRKKKTSEKAIAANRRNARLSRGPVTDEGKAHSRLNACKHNHRAELPILPGEDEDELDRRLEVWPQILGAETEPERLEAMQAVHMGWRRARSLRSDDAATERRMIDVKKVHAERQANEARQLGEQLDGDLDPAGVIRKLHRSPAGCNLLLKEFQVLDDRLNTYGVVFWSQRERLFHLLGKRLRDLFTDDPVITEWVVALIGAAYGDLPAEDKTQSIGEVLEGLRPSWMDGEVEYPIRLESLVAAVAGRDESIERVRSLVEAAIHDLKARLKRAKARSRRELKLELESAWVDDTVAGARRLRYQVGHDRSYNAALERLKKLQKARRAGDGSAEAVETTDEGEPGASGLGVGTREDTAAGSAATSDSSSLPRIENERVFSATRDEDSIATCAPEVAVTVDANVSSASADGNDPLPAAAENRLEPVTNEPIFSLTHEPLPAGSNAPSGKYETRNPKSEANSPDPRSPIGRWIEEEPCDRSPGSDRHGCSRAGT